MAIVKLSSASSLAEITDAVTKIVDATGVEFWWRGHATTDWCLRPGAFRKHVGTSWEKNLALRFATKAESRHSNCPDRQDTAGWLFLMQHWGLPTRLLDWTASAFIATWFAVSECDDKTGLIWGLIPVALNQHQLGKPMVAMQGYPPVRRFFDAVLGNEQVLTEKVAAVAPLETEPRMMVQHSTYTVHSTPDALEDIYDSPETPDMLCKIEIPPTAKSTILKQLRIMGITRSYLFPDLGNLAIDLAEIDPPSS